jgi:hypothetical protein
MDEQLDVARGALTFRDDAYQAFHARHDVFLRGAVLIVVVALLVSLPAFIMDLANGLRSQSPTGANNVSAQFEQGLQQALPFMQNVPPSVLQQIRQGFETGTEIAARIEALPTPIPRPIGRGLEALGRWLSQPFGSRLPLTAASLGTWLAYGIWVMLFAKLLGGRGDLAGFFGTTSLYALPHVLNIFGSVPYLGPITSVIAFAWGGAIYVKATAVSHQMTLSRALLAVILPVVALAALLAVLGLGFLVLVGILVSGR